MAIKTKNVINSDNSAVEVEDTSKTRRKAKDCARLLFPVNIVTDALAQFVARHNRLSAAISPAFGAGKTIEKNYDAYASHFLANSEDDYTIIKNNLLKIATEYCNVLPRTLIRGKKEKENEETRARLGLSDRTEDVSRLIDRLLEKQLAGEIDLVKITSLEEALDASGKIPKTLMRPEQVRQQHHDDRLALIQMVSK